MEIHHEALRDLYEKLIRQNVYPGRVCPAEHVMVDHESGGLPAEQARLVEEHLADCASCREDFVGLGRAAEWFRESEPWILMGLAAKAAAAGVLPWARCPSSQMLYRYASGELPETRGGGILLAEIREHLVRCPQCQRLSGEFAKAASGVRLSIRELGAQAGYAVMDRLRGFVDGLSLIAEATGAPAAERGAPGYRSGELATIAAPVVDAEGKVVVGEQGRPAQCLLEILTAGIAEDGFLTVDLAALDVDYRRRDDRAYQAAAALVAGDVRLELGRHALDEQGRVSFTGLIPQAKAVDPLPPMALDVVVSAQPAGSGDAPDEPEA